MTDLRTTHDPPSGYPHQGTFQPLEGSVVDGPPVAQARPFISPNAGAVARARMRLDSFFDPWLLDPFVKALRVDTCGAGCVLRFQHGRVFLGGTRCKYPSRCARCGAWQVGTRNEYGELVGDKKAWLRWYARMAPPLFSGADVIYWQPVCIGEAKAKGVPEVRRLADRARDRKLTLWTRIDTSRVVNYFSAVDLHIEGDSQASWPLTPEDAREFFFGDLLVPTVVQYKPTAGEGPWRLPTDKAMSEEIDRMMADLGGAEGPAAEMPVAAEAFDPYALASDPDHAEPAVGVRYLPDWSFARELSDATNAAIVRRWPHGAPPTTPRVLAEVKRIEAKQYLIIQAEEAARRRRFEAVRAG